MKSIARPLRLQRGGTLVGFVIGVLAGLGIALAVAVYVTKVPVPFVDRGVSRKPAQDAEEAERNKGWDPNAQFGGKPASASGAPAGTAAVGTVTAPATGTPAATVTPAAKSTATAADPLGDLVNAKLGQAPAVSADPFIYFVQAGAYRAAADAEAQRAKLAMLGMSAEISEREQAGRTVFRVRLGPFKDKPMADATREQLEVNGVEASLVRIQR